MANAELERFRVAGERGETITIPRLDMKQPPGELPPHWWLAIASRYRHSVPDQEDIITWAD